MESFDLQTQVLESPLALALQVRVFVLSFWEQFPWKRKAFAVY